MRISLLSLTLAFTLSLLSFQEVAAQTAQKNSKVDYSSINVGSIPEDQIKTQALKLKKAGVSLDEALAQAKAKGATPTQITQLRRRLARYLSNSSTSTDRRLSGAQTQTNSASFDMFGQNDLNLLDEEDETSTTLQQPVYTHEDSLLFGFDIFNRKGLTFEPSSNMAVGDSYVIGIGDQIDIDIYGSAEQSYQLTVAKDGTLSIPMVGPVRIGGLTMADAKAAILAKMRTIYSDMGSRTNASIRLAQANPVKVSVIGEAFLPGTYTVSAASSLFNVLYRSGGPTRNGSYRDIQLIRGGRVIAHLDVYDFLVNGKNDVNVSLADGDIVLIPTYIKRVMTGGAFKRVGYFEAKEGETVSDLIRYAGGFTPRAQSDHIGMFRVGKYTTEYIDVKDPSSVQLASGDSVVVNSIDEKRIDNAVTVEGAVFAPGTYEFSEGMKLSNLLEQAGGLTENAFLTRGVITRYKEDYTLEALNFNVLDVKNGLTDLGIKSGDIVTIASIDDMREQRTVTLSGEVQMPGVYEYRDNLTLGDVIVLANGLTENAQTNNVEIVRRIDDDANYDAERARELRTVIITRDLALDGKEDNSFLLKPFDQIFIRTKGSASIGGSIVIRGAVNNPGSYGLTNNHVTLSQMSAWCGGFSSSADIDAARIYRPIIISPEERSIKMRQSLARGDTLFYLQENGIEYDFVAIRLKDAINNPGSAADIYLRDGDILEIPNSSQTVRVSGIVQTPTSMIWAKGWNAKDYIKRAGGFAPRAYKKLTYVVHANGESESVRHILFFRKYPEVRPGSEVVVPQKPEPKLQAPAYVSMGSTLVSMAAIIVTLLK